MTIELRTGTSRAPRREDYCTKIAACGPKDIPTPLWDAFLDKVTAEDRELQGYLQRVAGYCLTGEVSEHALFFFYGTGANGKGVFLGTLRGISSEPALHPLRPSDRIEIFRPSNLLGGIRDTRRRAGHGDAWRTGCGQP
jgi:hypothetical protein